MSDTKSSLESIKKKLESLTSYQLKSIAKGLSIPRLDCMPKEQLIAELLTKEESVLRQALGLSWWHRNKSSLEIFGLAIGVISLVIAVAQCMQKSPATKEDVESISDPVRSDLHDMRKELADNPDFIASRMKKFIRDNANVQIQMNDGKWDVIAKIEEERDNQIEKVNDLIELISNGLKGTPEEIFVRTSKILADPDPVKGGPAATLKYLKHSHDSLLLSIEQNSKDEKVAQAKKQESLDLLSLEATLCEQSYEWDKALVIRRIIADKSPNSWDAQTQLGLLLLKRSLNAEAAVVLNRALTLAKDKGLRALSLLNLGCLKRQQGFYQESEKMCRESVELMEQLNGKTSRDTLDATKALSIVLFERGKLDEARRLSEQAYELCVQSFGNGDPLTKSLGVSIASMLCSMGDYIEAREWLGKNSISLLSTTTNNIVHVDHGDINLISVLLIDQKDYSAAQHFLEEALIQYRQKLGTEHPDTLCIMHNLAYVYECEGKHEDAKKMYTETLAARDRLLGQDNLQTANTLRNLVITAVQDSSHCTG